MRLSTILDNNIFLSKSTRINFTRKEHNIYFCILVIKLYTSVQLGHINNRRSGTITRRSQQVRIEVLVSLSALAPSPASSVGRSVLNVLHIQKKKTVGENYCLIYMDAIVHSTIM